METAAKNVPPVLLELGGKNPHIVIQDADVPRAIKSVQDGIFTNAGQMRWAGSRAYIHESIYDNCVNELVSRGKTMKLGPGVDESTSMRRLASKKRQETDLR